MSADLTLRRAARLLVLDEHDHVLLFCYEDDAVEDLNRKGPPLFWVTPGGGLDEGETFEQAAMRELREETGLVVDSPGKCVWVRERSFLMHGAPVRSDERYYLLRVSRAPVRVDGLFGWEAATYLEHRWWSLPELRACPDVIYPLGFADYLESLLRDEIPVEPVRVDCD
ncbi:MAG TPA: NUDIX domain-containing protein [Actinomycetota bacterium]|nr:NUDIX domain-containing protein [Actinomycetota bacterium]